MCVTCDFAIFWTTKYHTPDTFHLPVNQSSFAIHRYRYQRYPQPTQIGLQPLLATLGQITLPFTLPTRKFSLFGDRHYPVLCQLKFPSDRSHQARKSTFFPKHLLHSYNHPSYRRLLPHGRSQACLDVHYF